MDNSQPRPSCTRGPHPRPSLHFNSHRPLIKAPAALIVLSSGGFINSAADSARSDAAGAAGAMQEPRPPRRRLQRRPRRPPRRHTPLGARWCGGEGRGRGEGGGGEGVFEAVGRWFERRQGLWSGEEGDLCAGGRGGGGDGDGGETEKPEVAKVKGTSVLLL